MEILLELRTHTSIQCVCKYIRMCAYVYTYREHIYIHPRRDTHIDIIHDYMNMSEYLVYLIVIDDVRKYTYGHRNVSMREHSKRLGEILVDLTRKIFE